MSAVLTIKDYNKDLELYKKLSVSNKIGNSDKAVFTELAAQYENAEFTGDRLYRVSISDDLKVKINNIEHPKLRYLRHSYDNSDAVVSSNGMSVSTDIGKDSLLTPMATYNTPDGFIHRSSITHTEARLEKNLNPDWDVSLAMGLGTNEASLSFGQKTDLGKVRYTLAKNPDIRIDSEEKELLNIEGWGLYASAGVSFRALAENGGDIASSIVRARITNSETGFTPISSGMVATAALIGGPLGWVAGLALANQGLITGDHKHSRAAARALHGKTPDQQIDFIHEQISTFKNKVSSSNGKDLGDFDGDARYISALSKIVDASISGVHKKIDAAHDADKIDSSKAKDYHSFYAKQSNFISEFKDLNSGFMGLDMIVSDREIRALSDNIYPKYVPYVKEQEKKVKWWNPLTWFGGGTSQSIAASSSLHPQEKQKSTWYKPWTWGNSSEPVNAQMPGVAIKNSSSVETPYVAQSKVSSLTTSSDLSPENNIDKSEYNLSNGMSA